MRDQTGRLAVRSTQPLTPAPTAHRWTPKGQRCRWRTMRMMKGKKMTRMMRRLLLAEVNRALAQRRIGGMEAGDEFGGDETAAA